VNEIFKRLGIPKENAFKSLSESQGEARILVDLEFSRLQMC
jgi:hypothetical protein